MPLPILYYDNVVSTNNQAKTLAEHVSFPEYLIYANSQTTGRGRYNRQWESPTGNLYCSLILTPNQAERDIPQLSFVAAVALKTYLATLLPSQSITLKWPNDILVDSHKIAGILLEKKGKQLIIGIGLNILHYPKDSHFPATSIRNFLANPPETDQLLQDFLPIFMATKTQWEEEGFEPIRQTWLNAAHGLGKPIQVSLAEKSLHGTFEGIDTEGVLLLNEEKGIQQRIHAGDVFFR